MHDRAAGKVERAASHRVTSACRCHRPACRRPTPNGRAGNTPTFPTGSEHDHRAELHPLGKRAADQRRRDDEEHALKQHVREPRDGAFPSARSPRPACRFCLPRRSAARSHQQVIAVADPGAERGLALGAAEGERVSVEGPDHGHQPHQKQALHDSFTQIGPIPGPPPP